MPTRSQPTTAAPLLDQAVATMTATPDAPPGVCLAVSRRGAVAVSCTGVAQAFDAAGPLEHPAAMALDTATDVGSVTKIIATATSLLALASAGEVDLGSRLSAILPWAAGTPAAAASLNQLLQHRAGLWEWWPFYLESSDPVAVRRAAATRPLRHAPDGGRHYSDLGFILLGVVVAAVAGSDLASAVQTLVLDPMGMTATRFGAPAPDAPAVAASSRGDRIEREMIASGVPYPVSASGAQAFAWRDHVLVGEVNDGNAFHGLESCSGHAGLFSSAGDLLRFGDGLLAWSAGARGSELQSASQCFLTPGADPAQGLGFRCWPMSEGLAWGHTGFPGVAVAILPHLDATVTLVTNRLHVSGTPSLTEPMWVTALHAAEAHLTTGSEPSS